MEDIRNVSIIAHVDHGKSTLSDALLLKGGLISEKDAGTKRATDTRDDERERGITIKSVGVTMDVQFEGKIYKINLIDSPGHVDFSSEVSAALRLTDGALVVVDCVEGTCVQTETVLRQALQEKVRPVLFINKMDRMFLELQATPEAVYDRVSRIIEQVNILIATYGGSDDLLVDPVKGNVGFGSAYFGWGFTLNQFAKLYKGKDSFNFRARLWERERFANLVIKPIYNLYEAAMMGDVARLETNLASLGVKLRSDELTGVSDKKLFGLALKRMIPIAESLLELIIVHLPNPMQAQAQRLDVLYEGPLDDACGKAIATCDPTGPLMVYISKMIPASTGRFMAFGRVFSGTVRSGMRVFVQGPNYDPEATRKQDYATDVSIQRCQIMVAGKFETVSEVPCGNTVALIGVDEYLVKTGTITDHPQAYNIRTMKFSVSPVVKVAVSVKEAGAQGALSEALKKLSKSDPCVLCRVEESGEMTVAATGELHLEICLNDLRGFLRGATLVVTEPTVPFREAISAATPSPILCKTPNKLNRLFVTAEPLSEELVADLESGAFDVRGDSGKVAKELHEKYGWSLDEARKIWTWGPEGNVSCVLVNLTTGAQYLNEIRDSCKAAFNRALFQGPLCEELVRGVRINIVDASLHRDSAHRGGAQIMPAMLRAVHGAMLAAQPTLYEPLFRVEVTVPETKVGPVYGTITNRRGTVHSQELREGTPLVTIKGLLPVAESFGLNEVLRAGTSGEAFPALSFSHYEALEGDVYTPGNKNYEYITKVRVRKGLKGPVPESAEFSDKL